MPQFVAVPVPADLVTAVMKFIADRTASPLLTDHAICAWEVESLRHIATSELKSLRAVASLLDVLAAHPDRWFSTTALERETGISRSDLKGALSAFSRHIRARYERSDWPMETRWGPESPNSAEESHYRLSPETAALWIEAHE